MALIEQSGRGVNIYMKVIPNASQNEISGVVGDRVKIRVQAPPEDGKANDAVCTLIATMLGLSKQQISIVSGSSSPFKTVCVTGVTKSDVCNRIMQ